MGNNGANIDHGCFFDYKGQNYQANGGMDNPSRFFRASFLTYCHYRKNKEIVTDILPTVYGVGQYDAGWDNIRFVWFFDIKDAEKLEKEDGSFVIGGMKKGSFIKFPSVCHMPENAEAELSYCDAAEDTVIEIRENDEDGAVLGTVLLPCGKQKASCRLKNRAGHISLCFTVKSGGNVSLESFSLKCGTHRRSAEASRGILLGNAKVKACRGAAADLAVSLCDAGDGVKVSLDGGCGGEVRTVIRYRAEKEAVLSIKAVFSPVREISLPPTGGEVAELPFELSLAEGVSEVMIYEKKKPPFEVFIDSIRTELPQNIYRGYAAAECEVFPRGNGCWIEYPQREWDAGAFGGCLVNHMEKPGYKIVRGGVDGGDGGDVRLRFRYLNSGAEPILCSLKINGEEQGEISFLPTGGADLNDMKNSELPVRLKKGANQISLTVKSISKPGLCLEAFSVLPIK